MDLNNYMLIDISTGTVLTAEHCRLVRNDQITASEWNRFDEMPDTESAEIGRKRGQRITLDDQLVESIADALWGDGADTEWGPDTLDSIADAIRTLRPDLAGKN